MAFTTLLMTVTMASVVSAGFSSRNDDDNLFNSKMFRYVSSLSLPPLPNLPGFPKLSLPSPPPLLWPVGADNFPNFNRFPQVDFQSIASQGVQPGSNFNGGAVVSHSSSVRGPDGKVHRDGGSTVLLNNNGQVTMHQTGNAPPVIISQFTNPPNFKPFDFDMPTMKPFVMPTMKPFVMPTMKPFTFPKIPPIDPQTIKNHVPGENESYQGNYHSVSHYSSDVDGVKSSGGKIISIENDNGKVKETGGVFN